MLFLATDHRGLKLKNQIKAYLIDRKIAFKDLGVYDFDENDNYVTWVKLLAEKVLESKENRGIVLCGSGIGVSITANKIKGIYCGLGLNSRQIKNGVEHDHINVLAIASDETKKFKAFALVKTFLRTKYGGEKRHLKRIESIKELEDSAQNSKLKIQN